MQKDHLMNLRALFRIAKGSKVDAILEMPTPKNISTLKSFLASVQFYSKFLSPYFSEITSLFHTITVKIIKKKRDNNYTECMRRLRIGLQVEQPPIN